MRWGFKNKENVNVNEAGIVKGKPQNSKGSRKIGYKNKREEGILHAHLSDRGLICVWIYNTHWDHNRDEYLL